MFLLLLLLCCPGRALAKTIVHNFDIGWVFCSPDGFDRPVMGINGEWPLPTIEADLGDTVIVHVRNSLGNQTTSLHFHGMYQKGTTEYDGGVGVSQCPLHPGDTYTYIFTADPPGMSWYHAHDKGQYPDGLRGKLVVHDPDWEDCLDIDEQIYLSISDWYHDQQPAVINSYLNVSNTDGDLPSPDSFLFDDSRQGPALTFEPFKRYLIRLVSFSALACGSFHIEGHTLIIVGADGVHTHPHEVDTITICAGQRYDMLVVGSPDPVRSFDWVAKMSKDMLTHDIPSDEHRAVIGNVSYGLLNRPLNVHFHLPGRDRHGNRPYRRDGRRITPAWTPGEEEEEVVLDDMDLKPLNNTPLLTPVDRRIDLRTNQTYYEGIGTRIGAGAQPWTEPKVPTLYTALSTLEAAFEHSTYGPGVDPWVILSNEIVEIYMENPQPWPHPMHLHGHEFQVVGKGNDTWHGNEDLLPEVPLMRDTVVIPAEGYVVIRFIADNPGVWFFHCHIDMHLVAGMASTIIEAPDLLQQRHSIPFSGASVCKNAGMTHQGNCAGGEGTMSGEDANNECNTIFNVGGEAGSWGAQIEGMTVYR